MNGMHAEIRNHRTNELPLTRPTTPPARPKKNRTTTRPMSPGLASPNERLDCPEDRADDCNDHDGPEQPGHEADDELEGQHHGDDQDDRGDSFAHDGRGTRAMSLDFTLHGLSVLQRAGSPMKDWLRGQSVVD